MARVFGLTQTVYDVVADSQRKQRNVGTLSQDDSSLIIKGTLSKANTVDYFKFTVKKGIDDVGLILKATGAKPRAGAENSTVSSVDTKYDVGYSTIQILDKRGNVIASSSDDASVDQKKAYQNIRDKKLSLEAGNYTIKVTRAPGVLRSQKVVYAVQLLAGTQKKEYTTKQLDATSADATATPVRGASAVSIIDASKRDDTYTPTATGTLFDYYS